MNTPHKNWLEWTVFGLSLLLVLGTLGYLVYGVATDESTPPDIEIQLGAPQQGIAGFRIPITAINHGGTTAEGVLIEVTLTHGEEREAAQVEFPYVPHGSTREGWVVFSTAPQPGALTARMLGYEAP